MRALLGACWFALFAAPSFGADAGWGEPVNGLSVSISIVHAETGKHPAQAAVQFAIRNGLAREMNVPIGMLMNARKVPGAFSLVARDSSGVLRAGTTALAFAGGDGFLEYSEAAAMKIALQLAGAAILAVRAWAQSPGQLPTKGATNIISSRPLGDAAWQLEHLYGKVVTYEEPVLTWRGDLWPNNGKHPDAKWA